MFVASALSSDSEADNVAVFVASALSSDSDADCVAMLQHCHLIVTLTM